MGLRVPLGGDGGICCEGFIAKFLSRKVDEDKIFYYLVLLTIVNNTR